MNLKTKLYVYLSHLLSNWGEGMWMFGIGLFLMDFSPGSLRLNAIYGLSTGIVSLLFGALAGDWVDNTPRLKAARMALVLQKATLFLCAGLICTVFWLRDDISAALPSQSLIHLCHVVVILLAVLSSLASMTKKIVVERDWLVEICAKDKDLLASLSATMRAITLISHILSPLIMGHVIYFTELGYGAVLIGGWNFLSVFAEYYLLWKVHENVPALQSKRHLVKTEESIPLNTYPENTITDDTRKSQQRTFLNRLEDHNISENDPNSPLRSQENHGKVEEVKDNPGLESYIDTNYPTVDEEKLTTTTTESDARNSDLGNKSRKDGVGIDYLSVTDSMDDLSDHVETTVATNQREAANLANQNNTYDITNQSEAADTTNHSEVHSLADQKEASKGKTKCQWLLKRMFNNFITLYKGWRIFMKYDVACAGISLAFLYVTVLGFDNITVGFGYSQGLSSAVLGGFQTGASCTGILGTILYPRIRRMIGTERTGLFSLGAQITFLSLCVASVFAPGSPFNLSHVPDDNSKTRLTVKCHENSTQWIPIISGLSWNSSNHSDITARTVVPNVTVTERHGCNVTIETFTPKPDVSIWLLMAGIIASRCGLWMADLTIAQLFLERVKEAERGIVGGVQNSMNWLMDMLKFLIVVILPHPHQFGLLIILSFLAICTSWMLYAKFYCSLARNLRNGLKSDESLPWCKDSIIVEEKKDETNY